MSTIKQVNKTVEKTIKDALTEALASYSEALAGDKRWKELKRLVPDCTELVFSGDDSGSNDGDPSYTVWSPLFQSDTFNDFDPDAGDIEPSDTEDDDQEETGDTEDLYREGFQQCNAEYGEWGDSPKDEKLFDTIVKTVSAKDYGRFCELYQELVEEVTGGVGAFLPEETFRIKAGQ